MLLKVPMRTVPGTKEKKIQNVHHCFSEFFCISFLAGSLARESRERALRSPNRNSPYRYCFLIDIITVP